MKPRIGEVMEDEGPLLGEFDEKHVILDVFLRWLDIAEKHTINSFISWADQTIGQDHLLIGNRFFPILAFTAWSIWLPFFRIS